MGRAAGPAAEPPTQPEGLRAPAEGGGGLRPDPGGCEKTALTGGGQGGGYGWEYGHGGVMYSQRTVYSGEKVSCR